ncbi:hypothetical protein IscW_ISCW005046 [Ixodes scapularis]|uniref:Uncharacterized protein n=1 Tax=Ixodes scapularis TaxID=6945 RepID=B7PFL4_IXOSC|nr:hypothetical protein IscW_ISCW005046 [Ixodes scapularis]|eukprot:XP_002433986.1 hypothetical protein IscW_ISCW005046 [Ixodes scapularis]
MIPMRRRTTMITTSKPPTSGENGKTGLLGFATPLFPADRWRRACGPAPSPQCRAGESAALLRRAKVGAGREDSSLGRISPHSRECSWIVFCRPATLSATR